MAKPDPEEIFVQLIVTHQSALRAFVISMLPGSNEVDDVIQETNTEIWKKRGDFRIGTNFKSWMFSVAKFKVLSTVRNQSRKKEFALPEETIHLLLDEVQMGGAFDNMEDKQEALRACMKKLKTRDKSLILLRYIQGNSLAELATQIGRSPESLKVSIHRIRGLLRTCMTRRLSVQGDSN